MDRKAIRTAVTEALAVVRLKRYEGRWPDELQASNASRSHWPVR
jgi:hypothetical protein